MRPSQHQPSVDCDPHDLLQCVLSGRLEAVKSCLQTAAAGRAWREHWGVSPLHAACRLTQSVMVAELADRESVKALNFHHTCAALEISERLHFHLARKGLHDKLEDRFDAESASGDFARFAAEDPKSCDLEDILWRLKILGADFQQRRRQQMPSDPFRTFRLAHRPHRPVGVRRTLRNGGAWVRPDVGRSAEEELAALLRDRACVWVAAGQGVGALQHSARLHAQWGVGVRWGEADARGLTPLHVAAARGDTAAIAFLLEQRCDPAAQDAAGATALHCAARRAHHAAVRLLLLHAPSLAVALDHAGRSALHAWDWAAAADGEQRAALAALTRASPCAADCKGHTPLHACAAAGGSAEALRLLVERLPGFSLAAAYPPCAPRGSWPRPRPLRSEAGESAGRAAEGREREECEVWEALPTALEVAVAAGAGGAVEYLFEAGRGVLPTLRDRARMRAARALCRGARREGVVPRAAVQWGWAEAAESGEECGGLVSRGVLEALGGAELRHPRVLEAVCGEEGAGLLEAARAKGMPVPEEGRRAALRAASRRGAVEVVGALLGAGEEEAGGGAALGASLGAAVRGGHLAVAELLLESGADSTGREEEARGGAEESSGGSGLEELLRGRRAPGRRDGRDEQRRWRAVARRMGEQLGERRGGREGEVERVLERALRGGWREAALGAVAGLASGVAVGAGPLGWAVRDGDVEVVEAVLERGGPEPAVEERGQGLLLLALARGSWGVAAALCRHALQRAQGWAEVVRGMSALEAAARRVRVGAAAEAVGAEGVRARWAELRWGEEGADDAAGEGSRGASMGAGATDRWPRAVHLEVREQWTWAGFEDGQAAEVSVRWGDDGYTKRIHVRCAAVTAAGGAVRLQVRVKSSGVWESGEGARLSVELRQEEVVVWSHQQALALGAPKLLSPSAGWQLLEAGQYSLTAEVELARGPEQGERACGAASLRVAVPELALSAAQEDALRFVRGDNLYARLLRRKYAAKGLFDSAPVKPRALSALAAALRSIAPSLADAGGQPARSWPAGLGDADTLFGMLGLADCLLTREVESAQEARLPAICRFLLSSSAGAVRERCVLQGRLEVQLEPRRRLGFLGEEGPMALTSVGCAVLFGTMEAVEEALRVDCSGRPLEPLQGARTGQGRAVTGLELFLRTWRRRGARAREAARTMAAGVWEGGDWGRLLGMALEGGYREAALALVQGASPAVLEEQGAEALECAARAGNEAVLQAVAGRGGRLACAAQARAVLDLVRRRRRPSLAGCAAALLPTEAALQLAAAGACEERFLRAWAALGPEEQLERAEAQSEDGRTLLAHAIEGGSLRIAQAVLSRQVAAWALPSRSRPWAEGAPAAGLAVLSYRAVRGARTQGGRGRESGGEQASLLEGAAREVHPLLLAVEFGREGVALALLREVPLPLLCAWLASRGVVQLAADRGRDAVLRTLLARGFRPAQGPEARAVDAFDPSRQAPVGGLERLPLSTPVAPTSFRVTTLLLMLECAVGMSASALDPTIAAPDPLSSLVYLAMLRGTLGSEWQERVRDLLLEAPVVPGSSNRQKRRWQRASRQTAAVTFTRTMPLRHAVLDDGVVRRIGAVLLRVGRLDEAWEAALRLRQPRALEVLASLVTGEGRAGRSLLTRKLERSVQLGLDRESVATLSALLACMEAAPSAAAVSELEEEAPWELRFDMLLSDALGKGCLQTAALLAQDLAAEGGVLWRHAAGQGTWFDHVRRDCSGECAREVSVLVLRAMTVNARSVVEAALSAAPPVPPDLVAAASAWLRRDATSVWLRSFEWRPLWRLASHSASADAPPPPPPPDPTLLARQAALEQGWVLPAGTGDDDSGCEESGAWTTEYSFQFSPLSDMWSARYGGHQARQALPTTAKSAPFATERHTPSDVGLWNMLLRPMDCAGLSATLSRKTVAAVDLTGNLLASEGVRRLCASMALVRLRKLSLAANSVGSSGATALAAALPPQLALLDLDHNLIADDGLARLAEALPGAAVLSSLSVEHNAWGSDGASALARALPRCANLQHLRIAGHSLGAAAQRRLAQSLLRGAAHGSLRTVKAGARAWVLSELATACRVEESGMEASETALLLRMLQSRGAGAALTSLDLASCAMGGEEVRELLAAVLGQHSAITELALPKARVPSEQLARLAGAVSLSVGLRRVDLRVGTGGAEDAAPCSLTAMVEALAGARDAAWEHLKLSAVSAAPCDIARLGALLATPRLARLRSLVLDEDAEMEVEALRTQQAVSLAAMVPRCLPAAARIIATNSALRDLTLPTHLPWDAEDVLSFVQPPALEKLRVCQEEIRFGELAACARVDLQELCIRSRAATQLSLLLLLRNSSLQSLSLNSSANHLGDAWLFEHMLKLSTLTQLNGGPQFHSAHDTVDLSDLIQYSAAGPTRARRMRARRPAKLSSHAVATFGFMCNLLARTSNLTSLSLAGNAIERVIEGRPERPQAVQAGWRDRLARAVAASRASLLVLDLGFNGFTPHTLHTLLVVHGVGAGLRALRVDDDDAAPRKQRRREARRGGEGAMSLVEVLGAALETLPRVEVLQFTNGGRHRDAFAPLPQLAAQLADAQQPTAHAAPRSSLSLAFLGGTPFNAPRTQQLDASKRMLQWMVQLLRASPRLRRLDLNGSCLRFSSAEHSWLPDMLDAVSALDSLGLGSCVVDGGGLGSLRAWLSGQVALTELHLPEQADHAGGGSAEFVPTLVGLRQLTALNGLRRSEPWAWGQQLFGDAANGSWRGCEMVALAHFAKHLASAEGAREARAAWEARAGEGEAGAARTSGGRRGSRTEEGGSAQTRQRARGAGGAGGAGAGGGGGADAGFAFEHPQSLDLRGCGLVEFPEGVEHLTCLTAIDVSGNDALQSIPIAALCKLPSLSSLQCDGRPEWMVDFVRDTVQRARQRPAGAAADSATRRRPLA